MFPSMLTDQKLFCAVEVLLLLICLISHVAASVRSGKSRASIQNEEVFNGHSSNQITANDEKPKSEEEQLYYLPMQTVFGVTEILTMAGGLSTTSPPHLTINPASMQTTFQQSTSIFNEDSYEHSPYNAPFHGQCVSETPVNDLESHLLVPSRDLMKESVVMSGHLEIASKTSSDEEVSRVNHFVSQPSIALQGTILHSHTVSDV